MNPELFVQELKANNVDISPAKLQLFQEYFSELIQANKKVNLTRITDQDEVYLKHFYDSLTPLLVFPDLLQGVKSLCDVGAGAGFPSLPLKIMQPRLEVTIVDSLGKRLKFLQDLLTKLQLTQVHLLHARAEDAGQNASTRENFDLVTARAVAKMPVLSEYCLPLVKVGGYLIALKGPKAEEELKAAQKAIQLLGGKITRVKEITLAQSDEQRTLIVIQKIKKTPKKYPRQAGTPHRKPII